MRRSSRQVQGVTHKELMQDTQREPEFNLSFPSPFFSDPTVSSLVASRQCCTCCLQGGSEQGNHTINPGLRHISGRAELIQKLIETGHIFGVVSGGTWWTLVCLWPLLGWLLRVPREPDEPGEVIKTNRKEGFGSHGTNRGQSRQQV